METTMTKYSCGRMRPLSYGDCVGEREVFEAGDAAHIFADREARRIYGRRGFCHHVRKDCWREDGSSVTFEAFIGVPWERTGCSGKNIWLTVSIED